MVRRLEGYRLLGCRFDLDKSIFFGTIEEPERGLWNELFVDLTACHTYNLTYLSVYSPKALIHRADSGSAYCHGSPSSLICFFLLRSPPCSQSQSPPQTMPTSMKLILSTLQENESLMFRILDHIEALMIPWGTIHIEQHFATLAGSTFAKSPNPVIHTPRRSILREKGASCRA